MIGSLVVALLTTAATAATQPPATATILRTLIVLDASAASASLIDPDSGVLRGTVAVGDGPRNIAVSPDGRTAVVCNSGTDRLPGSSLTVFNVVAGRVLNTIKLREPDDAQARTLHRPRGLCFADDGARVALVIERERRLVIVDLAAATVSAALDTRVATPLAVACTPDFARAFVANTDSGTVSVFDLAGQRLLDVIAAGTGASHLTLHPTRGELWVTNPGDDSLAIIDTTTLRVIARVDCGKFPQRLSFTPDGNHALVANTHSGNVAVIDVAQRTISHRITMNEPAIDATPPSLALGENPVPADLVVRPDGRYAYVISPRPALVTVLDLRAWRIARRLAAGGDLAALAWSEVRLDK